MKKTISKILVFAMVVALFAFGTGMATASAASDYPSKNITVICPYGAGGTTDLCIRGMVDAIPDGTLPKRVNILTNNVTGAAGLVGSTQFVNSPSDGYTLGILNCDLILHNVKGTTEISYDQFTPVACLMNQPNLVVVNTEGKFNSFEDLMNYAKENPGELKVANSGEGGIPRLCAQAVEQALGLEFKYINYDSDGACAVAVVAGEADCAMISATAANGPLQANTVKPVAVSDGSMRMESYPEVPAWGEFYDELKDIDILTFVYLVVKNDVDADIASYLQEIFAEANATEKFKETQKAFNIEPTTFDEAEKIVEFFEAQKEFYVNLING